MKTKLRKTRRGWALILAESERAFREAMEEGHRRYGHVFRRLAE